MEARHVKVPLGLGWRDFYETRVRSAGKKRPGCGGEKESAERLMLSRFKSKCRICKGPIYAGDWIYWRPYRGKARHAPSGYKAVDTPEAGA